ncbi:hypothetical protein HID58_047764, partial [Brassica napus]
MLPKLSISPAPIAVQFIVVKNLCLDLASFSCYVCCLHSQYVCYGSTTSTPLFAREIMTIFSCSNVLDRAALRGSGFEYCWLLSYEQEVRLELSGVPKNIETLRCRFVFLITTKVLDILLQHGYKIWKYLYVVIAILEMYGEDLDDSNVALYSEWKYLWVMRRFVQIFLGTERKHRYMKLIRPFTMEKRLMSRLRREKMYMEENMFSPFPS